MKKYCILVLAVCILMIKNSHADIDAWPLLEITEDSTTICYPLYVKEKNFQMIFPIYFNTNEGKDYHFFWPLLKISENRLKRAIPFWYTENESFTFFPLISQTPKYTFWSVPPMYFDKESKFSAVIPLFIKNDNKRFIFPNIYYKKKNDIITDFKLFPIVDYVNDKDVKSMIYFYLLGNKQKKDFYCKWLLPFYYSCKKKGEETLWALPYYYKKNAYQVIHEIVPIYQKREGQWHRSFKLFNYYHQVEPTWKKNGLFPLYEVKQSQLSQNRLKSVIDLFWFIYRKETITSENGKLLERNRRFLIFSDELKNDGKRLFKILGNIISERVVDN